TSGVVLTPEEVLAACTVSNTCSGDTTTTNNPLDALSGNYREKLGNITVQSGASVTGQGLGTTSTNPTVTNSGTIQSNAGTNQNALDIRGTRTSTYIGNVGSKLDGDRNGLNISGRTVNTSTAGSTIIGQHGDGINATSLSIHLVGSPVHASTN